MKLEENVVKVGIADLKIAKYPSVLRTSGLGSCVGIVIYDLSLKVAGMSHIMLPNSKLSKRDDINYLKYADTAINQLVTRLLDSGARKFALKAKIAGGAQMFSFASTNDMLKVGERNIEAVMEGLQSYRIPLISSDVGGNSGRTIEFFIDTGVLRVKTVNSGITEM